MERASRGAAITDWIRPAEKPARKVEEGGAGG